MFIRHRMAGLMLASATALGSQVAGSSGFCLDQPGGSRQAGLALQLYTGNGTGAQLWNTSGFL